MNDNISTIGLDSNKKIIKINDYNIKLQIWDTEGQERFRFRNIISSYYRGVDGIMIVYDIADIESFNSLDSWLVEVIKKDIQMLLKIYVKLNEIKKKKDKSLIIKEMNMLKKKELIFLK